MIRDIRRPSSVAAALLAAAVFAPAAEGAALSGYLVGLRATDDGSLRVLTVVGSYGKPQGVVEHRVDPSGATVRSVAVVPRKARQEWVDGALAGDGAVAAYRIAGKRRSVIRAVIARRAGSGRLRRR